MMTTSTIKSAVSLAVIGLCLSTGAAASDRDFRYFAEIGAGKSRLATGPVSEDLNAASFAAGIVSSDYGSLSLEHVRTLDDINGFDWNVTLVRTQFERNPLRDGWSWYGSLNANRVSAGSNVSSSTGFNVGAGLGVRYQRGDHRLFVNADLYNSDFGYLGAGYRHAF